MRPLLLVLIGLLFGNSPVALAYSCRGAGEFHFEHRSIEITATEKERINSLFNLFVANRNIVAVGIEGHADPHEVPYAKQDQLALDRAKAIANYVSTTYPELKEKIKFWGQGASQPMSESDAVQNRRVVIEIPCLPKTQELPKK